MTVSEIKAVLTGFAALIGIPATNMPAEEVMLATIQALSRNFGNMHEGDIRSAFEMAATGQLDINEHYQNLSLKFICGVLNAFRVKVNLAMRYYENARQEPVSIPYEGEVDWASTVQYLLEAVKRQDPKTLIIPVDVYSYLYKKDLLPKDTETKKRFMDQAIAQLIVEITDKTLRGTVTKEELEDQVKLKKRDIVKGDALYQRIALIAKRNIVRAYLVEKSHEGSDGLTNHQSSPDHA